LYVKGQAGKELPEARANYQAAIVELDKAIELDPTLGNAFYYRHLCHKRLGDQMKADADYQRARQLAPDTYP
jgi:tetratricopeptide (TPR) repeat protein